MYFWFVFTVLLASIVFLDIKFKMLRDTSTLAPRPYSFSRVQLAWWTVIILSSFIAIIIQCGAAPTFDSSTLILLGISAATTTSASIIDAAQQDKPNVVTNVPGENFLLDIMSDENGVNIHRFQTIVFNITFGVWFIAKVVNNLSPDANVHINDIMPRIENNNLILLGLSNGVYAGLKMMENRTVPSAADPQPEFVPNEAGNNAEPAEG